MSRKTPVGTPIYSLLPTEVEGFESLAELALDMHWYWNHSVDEVWRQLDPALWEITSNPWVVLQTVSRDHLRRALSNHAFRNFTPTASWAVLPREEMKLLRPLAGAPGVSVYRAAVPATRQATDYKARAIPHCDGVATPLEDAHILWQR